MYDVYIAEVIGNCELLYQIGNYEKLKQFAEYALAIAQEKQDLISAQRFACFIGSSMARLGYKKDDAMPYLAMGYYTAMLFENQADQDLMQALAREHYGVDFE